MSKIFHAETVLKLLSYYVTLYALRELTELKLHAFYSLYTALAYEHLAVKTTPVQAALGCQGFANKNQPKIQNKV